MGLRQRTRAACYGRRHFSSQIEKLSIWFKGAQMQIEFSNDSPCIIQK